MILRFLFYAFLLYIAYRLVFDLVLPVYRTTRRIKKGLREMQDQLRQQPAQPYAPEPSQKKAAADGGSVGDYIDFEEVR